MLEETKRKTVRENRVRFSFCWDCFLRYLPFSGGYFRILAQRTQYFCSRISCRLSFEEYKRGNGSDLKFTCLLKPTSCKIKVEMQNLSKFLRPLQHISVLLKFGRNHDTWSLAQWKGVQVSLISLPARRASAVSMSCARQITPLRSTWLGFTNWRISGRGASGCFLT